MAKILHLPAKPPAKLGYQRVQPRKKKDPEGHGQMNLFNAQSGQAARIVTMPSRFGPFEEALNLDELEDPRAAEVYWQAISEGDCVADAYCNLGILESRDGKTEKAFDCFTKSLTAQPRHLESHYNLANLYFDLGDLRLAREHYEMATQIDPGFPNIYFNLGLVHAMNDCYDDAIAAFSRYCDIAGSQDAGKAGELIETLRQFLQ